MAAREMSMKEKVLVVGAGPGGLAAAMVLAHRGYDVEVYEKHADVGGRNAALEIDGYKFDVGPTFLMLPEILDEIFSDCGRKVSDYLDIRPLDPMYRLRFKNEVDFLPTGDRERMAEEIERVFPGDSEGYARFMEKEGKKFDRLYPCLRVPYDRLSAFFQSRFLKAIPYLDVTKTVHDRLATYFRHPDMRVAMAFQSKYLGMSPWNCPAAFTILPYIEHKFGIHHPIGGLNAISHAMAKVVREEGGTIHLGTTVKEIVVESRRAAGLLLESGETVAADHVVINADFAYAMSRLISPEHRRKYTNEDLARREYSCSIFMLYFGIKRRYEELPHHNIVFADDYQGNVEDISSRKVLSEDPSFYVQNACIVDPSLAPEGKSTLYVLVPVANLTGTIDWEKESRPLRDKIVEMMKTKLGLTDLEEQIEVEKITTPVEWRDGYNVYEGAVFNLAHNIGQMLYFRPHNRSEELESCYVVGGGTHPGSGLPTIWQSGRIAADMISGSAVKAREEKVPDSVETEKAA